MFYKLAPLILRSSEKRNSVTSDVYFSQPDSDKEDLAGKLFIIIEIETKTADGLKILNFLIDNLEHTYYQNEKLMLRERLRTVKIEHIFETALAKTNKNLADFIRLEKIEFDPNAISAIAGVIHENSIHFANVGKNRAFLIYKDKAAAIPVQKNRAYAPVNDIKYKIVNVLEKTGENSEKKQINSSKLFSSVISGAIPTSGYFVLANEALSEYLSSKQLIDIATTLPPMSAVEQIRNILSKVNAYVSFLGIIIKNTTGVIEAEPRVIEAASTTQESISGLNTVEDTTEKLLSPGGYINFKKWFGGAGQLLSGVNLGFLKIKSDNFPGASALKDRIFFKKRAAFLSFEKISSFIKNITSFAVNFFIYLFQLFSSKERMSELAKNISARASSLVSDIRFSFTKFYFWLRNLDRKNKILLFVTILSLAVFARNIIVMNIRNQKAAETESLASLSKSIEQKQTQIEANMLYNNEKEAKRLLSEMESLLAKLPKDENDQKKTEYAAFYKKYNEELEKIRRVVRLEGLNEIANFSKLDNAAKPANLIIAGDKIYSADENSKTIYSLGVSNNLVTSANASGAVSSLKYPFPDKNNNIYFLNGAGFIMLDTETQRTSDFKLNSMQAQNINSAAFYNNKLYLLDSPDGKIYRYNKEKTSFSGGVSWLQEAADLSSAASMDIDGSIYVLRTNGEILKFAKGKKQDFRLDEADPKIENATKLSAKDEQKYIYVLEPSKKRLIVFDKDGKYAMQYTSDQFTDLKDFAVDEKNKTMYFLNSSSVFKVEAKHLDVKK